MASRVSVHFSFGLITINTSCWFHTADKLRISSTPIGVILRVAFLSYVAFDFLYGFAAHDPPNEVRLGNFAQQS